MITCSMGYGEADAGVPLLNGPKVAPFECTDAMGYGEADAGVPLLRAKTLGEVCK